MDSKSIIALDLIAIIFISFVVVLYVSPSTSFEQSLITGASVATPSSIDISNDTGFSNKDLVIVFPLLITILILAIFMVLIHKKSIQLKSYSKTKSKTRAKSRPQPKPVSSNLSP
jgi:hypothetical protein